MAGPMRYRWQDWVNLVLGIWLIMLPMFGLAQVGTAAAWNGYVVGAIVTVVALWAMSRPERWEEGISTMAGLWLILAPFALGFNADLAATWNHVIVGLLIAADAFWAWVRPRPVPHMRPV